MFVEQEVLWIHVNPFVLVDTALWVWSGRLITIPLLCYGVCSFEAGRKLPCLGFLSLSSDALLGCLLTVYNLVF